MERLWKAGFALGLLPRKHVALEDDGSSSRGSALTATNSSAHKTLDAIGDLALAGLPIIGAYRSYCGGHKMNVAVLEALFSMPRPMTSSRPRAPSSRRSGVRQTLRAGAAVYAPDVN